MSKRIRKYISKKINQIIADSLLVMFVAHIVIFGDGLSYGILHVETVSTVAIKKYSRKQC